MVLWGVCGVLRCGYGALLGGYGALWGLSGVLWGSVAELFLGALQKKQRAETS